MKYYIIVILFLSVIMSCTNQNDGNIIHPTKANLLVENSKYIKYNVINAVNNSIPDQYTAVNILQGHLESMDKVDSIGTLYGEDIEMFGSIRDVVIDSLGRIYYLDFNKQHIQVYNNKGKYVTTLGARGDGPGEFEVARTMGIYNNSWLLVSNGYRIEIFDISGPRIQFLKTVKLNAPVRSICILNQKLYAHYTLLYDQEVNMDETKSIPMIRAYNLPSFDPQFRFGESYISNNPMVKERMTIGNLGCHERSTTVIFVSERLPMLHGYSAIDGTMKWKSRIDGLHLAHVTETNEGGRTRLTYSRPESNIMDFIFPTMSVNIKGEIEVFQVLRSKQEQNSFEHDRSILTFQLNSASGVGELISNEKIPLIFEVKNDIVVGVSKDLIQSYVYHLRM